MQASWFCHSTRWNSVILTDFHFVFLLFFDLETQSEPWRKGRIAGANPHGSNPNKMFTLTSVKQNCEVSHTDVCRMYFVKAMKYFYMGLHYCIYFLRVFVRFLLFTREKQTQRNLDVVLRTTLPYEKQNKPNCFSESFWISHSKSFEEQLCKIFFRS